MRSSMRRNPGPTRRATPRSGGSSPIRARRNARTSRRPASSQSCTAVAIRNDVVKQNPSLPLAVFEAYSSAKQQMYTYLQATGWYKVSLPWLGQELESTRALMGDNYWPYGIEPNRKALEALFQYSHEQGLAKQKLEIEEVFHSSTLALVEDGE